MDLFSQIRRKDQKNNQRLVIIRLFIFPKYLQAELIMGFTKP